MIQEPAPAGRPDHRLDIPPPHRHNLDSMTTTDSGNMIISYHSDLHVDKHHADPLCDQALLSATGADVIVLAGDISNHRELTARYCLRVAADHPAAQIILVAGNHDHYHNEIADSLAFFRRELAKADNIHFLENQCLLLERSTPQGMIRMNFLGCTYWTDYLLQGEQNAPFAMHNSSLLRDFSVVETVRDGQPELITPGDIAAINRESRHWLQQQLARLAGQNTCVITHFAAHPAHDSWNNSLSPFFVNQFTNIEPAHMPDFWISGHTHYNTGFVEGRTRFISNCLGYPQEITGYRKDAVLVAGMENAGFKDN